MSVFICSNDVIKTTSKQYRVNVIDFIEQI